MNTPNMVVRIPEPLRESAQQVAGPYGLSAAIRAGLQLLTECTPEKARDLLDSQYFPRGPRRESRKTS